MIRRIVLATVLAAVALAPTPAFAQQPPPEDVDKVVVEGRRLEEAVRDFVAEVGAAPKGINLARWDRRVCVGAVNLKPDYAQMLVDKVSLAAVAVGLEPGEPGCRANVLILADSDGDALAQRLVKDSLRDLRPPDTDASTIGRSALRKFETSDAPVRWWHVSQTVLADSGVPVADGSTHTVYRMGRLRSNVREDMNHVIIILDTSKIGVVSFASLADYVSMVSLAQVDAEAETSDFPSILNLFADKTGERTARLTQWDLDYLTALYETDGDAASSTMEARRIARKMLNEQLASDRDAGR